MGPTKSTTRGRPNQNPTNTNLQPQQQLHQHPTKSTKRGKPNPNPTPTSLQLQPQLRQHPTNSTKRGKPNQTLTNPQPQLQLQHHPTKDRRETPPSVHHQSQPVEASATYQALSSASITIRAAVAATIPMTAQPPSLSSVIFLLAPSLVGRYPDWYSVSEDMCAIDIF